MKKLTSATIIFCTFLFNSCEPVATFDKPQPEIVKSLTSFPERLQGKYLAADQASIVTISDKLITRHYDFDFKEHKDSIRSPYKIVDDTLVNLTYGTKEIVTFECDTVIQHANWKDTLFNISTENVLKKFKGYFFLNTRFSDHAWEVKKVSLKKGMLTFGSISDIDDLQKLKGITETNSDTISQPFTLPRRQFKKFVKQNGFSKQETFSRITENGK